MTRPPVCVRSATPDWGVSAPWRRSIASRRGRRGLPSAALRAVRFLHLGPVNAKAEEPRGTHH